jgi:disulfide bond formation protein DsbB
MTAAAGFASRIRNAGPQAAAWIVALVSAATISGALVFEWFGFAPCELCLQQRWAYYIGVPLAIVAALAGAFRPRAGGIILISLALLFAGSAAFGAWHAGVEWGFWQGPAGCTGVASQRAADMGDFLKQIEATRLVRCDEVSLRIFGLSLAGWNAVISVGLSALAAIGVRNGLSGPAPDVR